MSDIPYPAALRPLLVVAYSFPPKGGAGVQRTAKFVKYLPGCGWQPFVLTTTDSDTVRDESLLADIPPETRISRVRGVSLPRGLPWRMRQWITRWLLVVDQEIGWLPFAKRTGMALYRRHPWEVIYSTAPPYTEHLVARVLKRALHTPWVADFRDAWLDNPSLNFPTWLHRQVNARLEREVVTSADRVIVVSEPMRQMFLRRYPSLPPAKFVTIPNGFDADDFQDVQPAQRDKRFTLVYTGSLYEGRRSAGPFLEALRGALNENRIKAEEFRVIFAGSTGKELPSQVGTLGLGQVVEIVGYVSHRESIAYQLCADALLLIIGAGPGSEAVLTGKVFEYLKAGKRILALIPPGAAADLLAGSGTSAIVIPGDVGAIRDALVDLVHTYPGGRLTSTHNPEWVEQFSRKNLTGRLADILGNVMGEFSEQN